MSSLPLGKPELNFKLGTLTFRKLVGISVFHFHKLA